LSSQTTIDKGDTAWRTKFREFLGKAYTLLQPPSVVEATASAAAPVSAAAEGGRGAEPPEPKDPEPKEKNQTPAACADGEREERNLQASSTTITPSTFPPDPADDLRLLNLDITTEATLRTEALAVLVSEGYKRDYILTKLVQT
jgi:hypothetical protein